LKSKPKDLFRGVSLGTLIQLVTNDLKKSAAMETIEKRIEK